ncbi:MAG: AAA family ATPase, partial [Planctomycetia bacterium]
MTVSHSAASNEAPSPFAKGRAAAGPPNGVAPDTAVAAALREEVLAFGRQVQSAVGKVVVGMESVTEQFLIALLAGGHILLEGVPGTAKTTLAKAFAQVLGIQYHRVQFTPDLLPSDVTGTYIFDRKSNDFQLRKGPVFCQLLLADEINRAPAKTQSALLEAMQEIQVTIEGTTLPLPRPFMVLATQNPVEQEGVYRLPEAQLDRFLMRVEIGYPTRETEISILRLHSGPKPAALEPLAGAPTEAAAPPTADPALPVESSRRLLHMQEAIHGVFAEPGVMQYIVDLARASRSLPDLSLGASPRASIFLLQCARGRALLAGRHYCTHEDVHAV